MMRHFPIVIEQDDDGVFIIECLSFRGCRSYGHTVDEALLNIREAIEACLGEQKPDAPGLTFIGVRDLEMVIP